MYFRVDGPQGYVNGCGKKKISASEFSEEDGFACFYFDAQDGPELHLELQPLDLIEVRDLVMKALIECRPNLDQRMAYLRNLREIVEGYIVECDHAMESSVSEERE